MIRKIKNFKTSLILAMMLSSVITIAAPDNKTSDKDQLANKNSAQNNNEDFFDIQFNSAFDSLRRNFFNRSFSGSVSYVNFPALDIYENDDKYFIKAELAGVSKDQIEINVDNNILTLKVTKNDDDNKSRKDYYMREIYYGTSQRSFTLPNYIDTNSIDTSFKNNILKIEMKKREGSKARNIEIKS